MRPDVETAIVDSLYRGACDPGEFQRAIDGIAAAFDCPSLFLGDLDLHDPGKISLLGAGLMDDARIALYTSVADIDYLTPVFSRLPPGTAGLTYRLLDTAKVQRLAFHDIFVRPLSIDHVLASPLHVSGSRVAMIALHQTENRRRLDDGDAAALERLVSRASSTSAAPSSG